MPKILDYYDINSLFTEAEMTLSPGSGRATRWAKRKWEVRGNTGQLPRGNPAHRCVQISEEDNEV
jgi:hypothetical protein